MHFACFSLANCGACSPSFWSQTHRIHSEGTMTFGPESTAQMKPSKVGTSIAFSSSSSESRNPLSSSISRSVSGPDWIGLIGKSHFIAKPYRLFTLPLDGNSVGAHPVFGAKITQLVDGLPLPGTLPPVEIGGFRRLDAVAEIRDIAKDWQNCLADCLFNVNEGTSAIYLSNHRQAVCFLCRYGRMGWFLLQAKGPKNAAIEPHQLAQIHAAFADAGIPQSSMIDAIKSIIKTDEWPRYHQGLVDDEIFDDIAPH